MKYWIVKLDEYHSNLQLVLLENIIHDKNFTAILKELGWFQKVDIKNLEFGGKIVLENQYGDFYKEEFFNSLYHDIHGVYVSISDKCLEENFPNEYKKVVEYRIRGKQAKEKAEKDRAKKEENALKRKKRQYEKLKKEFDS